MLPEPPTDAERASYSWRSLPSLAAALSVGTLCVIAAQLLFETRSLGSVPVVAAIFGGYTLVSLTYQLLSLPVHHAGPGFDLAAHDTAVRSWRPARLPSVDILLPVCGEPADVLRNAWAGVLELIAAYPGEARGHVLDDGPDPELVRDGRRVRVQLPEAARPALAPEGGKPQLRVRQDHRASTSPSSTPASGRGPTSWPRPCLTSTTRRWGSCRPRRSSGPAWPQSWVECAARPVLEVFYRAGQVSRNTFSSALCIGSNAVYRRTALEPTGGFTLLPHAEDSHTGLDARDNGFRLTYIPVPLAAGIGPATLEEFLRQQHRWCWRATSLVWTRHMWRVPMPLAARLPYVTGWLWNLTTALRTLILPLIPIALLALAPQEISLRNGLLLMPAVLSAVVLYPLWHSSRYSLRAWPLSLAMGWAQILGLWDYASGRAHAAARGPGLAARRFWWGITAWNGGLAVAWIALALWRTAATRSGLFAAVAALGAGYLIVVGRLVFPGRKLPVRYRNGAQPVPQAPQEA